MAAAACGQPACRCCNCNCHRQNGHFLPSAPPRPPQQVAASSVKQKQVAEAASEGKVLSPKVRDLALRGGGNRWVVFTPLVALTCALLLAQELRMNASGVDFSVAPTDNCRYQYALGDHAFCAASLAVNPFFGPAAEVLERLGGVSGSRVVEHGEAWRLLTGPFLHGGAIHYAVNMLVLIVVGRPLEQLHGAVRIGAIYLLSGSFGAVATAALAPHLLSVGASGAVFGLVGAAAGNVVMNWDVQASPGCALFRILLATALELLLGAAPLVDNFAHVFGFVMGLISSFVFLDRLNKRPYCLATCSRRFFRLLAAGCAVLALAAGLLVLFGLGGVERDEGLCPECAAVSCGAFPWGCEDKAPASCWWTCDTLQPPMQCSGEATWGPARANATVDLGCPLRRGGFLHVGLRSVDATAWDSGVLAGLCREHCPGAGGPGPGPGPGA